MFGLLCSGGDIEKLAGRGTGAPATQFRLVRSTSSLSSVADITIPGRCEFSSKQCRMKALDKNENIHRNNAWVLIFNYTVWMLITTPSRSPWKHLSRGYAACVRACVRVSVHYCRGRGSKAAHVHVHSFVDDITWTSVLYKLIL